MFEQCMQSWILSPPVTIIYINQPCYTALSFVDLRKAFNTVSHETILNKLSNYQTMVVEVWLII